MVTEVSHTSADLWHLGVFLKQIHHKCIGWGLFGLCHIPHDFQLRRNESGYLWVKENIMYDVTVFQQVGGFTLMYLLTVILSSLYLLSSSCIVTRHGWLRSMSMPNRMWCSCSLETRQGIMGSILDDRGTLEGQKNKRCVSDLSSRCLFRYVPKLMN